MFKKKIYILYISIIMENTAKVEMEAMGSVPIGLRYSAGVSPGVPGERALQRFTAENASVFSGSGNNVVRIPVSSGHFLDLKNAVLGYDFKNTTTGGGGVDTSITLDGSAACTIQRIRILDSRSSNEIERVDSYNLVHSVLDQYSSNLTNMQGSNILSGAPRRIQNNPATGTVALTQASKTGTDSAGTQYTIGTLTGQAITINSGLGGKGYVQEEADSLNTGISRHYEFGLKNGWFNPASAKYLPPMVAFTIELTLAPPANCLKKETNAVPGYNAQNFMLSIPSVTLTDPAFQARMNQRLAQGVSWRATTFSHHVNTLAAGAGRTSVQLGERARVLKGFMNIMRIQANVTDGDKFKLSKRSIQYVDNYQYQIGSTLYPNNQIDIVTEATPVDGGTAANTRLAGKTEQNMNISEAYSELLRVVGGINTSSGTTLIGQEPFAQSELNNGAGVLALDLQTYSDGSVSSGINTSNGLPCVLNVQKNAAASTILQIDTFAIAELQIMIDPSGIITSMS